MKDNEVKLKEIECTISATVPPTLLEGMRLQSIRQILDCAHTGTAHFSAGPAWPSIQQTFHFVRNLRALIRSHALSSVYVQDLVEESSLSDTEDEAEATLKMLKLV